jgi:hypothetical protein
MQRPRVMRKGGAELPEKPENPRILRTRREHRHLSFYAARDNLANVAADATCSADEAGEPYLTARNRYRLRLKK